MADGMNFLFTIDSNTPGLDTLLANLDKANVSMQKGHAGLKGLDEGMKHGAESAKGLGGAFNNLIDKGLDPFLHKAKEIAEFEFIREGAEKLLEFPGELADKLKELGEDLVTTAAKTERIGLAFQNSLGKGTGKDTLEYFDAIASKTEFTHEQIRGMGLELSKSGFKGEGLKNAIAAVADLGSMSVNPEQGAMEAVSALQRIMTSGRIEGRALVPFGIQKGEFMKELSAETGLGLQGVEKQLDAGKIPIETTLNSLYESITHKTGKDLGGAGTAMADTVSAKLAHLKEMPDLAMERFADTAAFTKLSTSLGHVLDELDPTKEPGAHIFKGIEQFFETLPGMIDLTTKALKGMGAAMTIAAGPLAPLIAIGAGEAVMTKSQRAHVTHDVSQAVFGHSDAEIDQMGFFEKLGVGIKGFGETAAGIVTGHHFGAHAAHDTGTNDVKGYVGGIDDATPEATKAMTRLGDATVKSLKDAHEQHSPSELFKRIAGLDVEGYAIGTEEGSGRIGDAMQTTYMPPSSAAIGGGNGAPVTFGDINLTVEVTNTGAGDGQDLGRAVLAQLEDNIELLMLRALERVAKARGH